ncbi:hypothetical protein A225_4672 [Klebsiella michiganensis E718]|nr:hypothetical protein A225_4672 [Klebsiella michiganensis E718]
MVFPAPAGINRPEETWQQFNTRVPRAAILIILYFIFSSIL